MAQNMPYCRFGNTFAALRECVEALEEADGPKELSPHEYLQFQKLVRLAGTFHSDWESCPADRK